MTENRYSDLQLALLVTSDGQLPEEAFKPIGPAHHPPPAIGADPQFWPTVAADKVSLLALVSLGLLVELFKTNLENGI